MLHSSPRNCGCGMNLTCRFFVWSSAEMANFSSWEWRKGSYMVLTVCSTYSKLLVDSLLSVLYALAYYLTPAIVLSNSPFRFFVPLPFINCVPGTRLNPLKLQAHVLLCLCSHVPPSGEPLCLLPLTLSQDIYVLPVLQKAIQKPLSSRKFL